MSIEVAIRMSTYFLPISGSEEVIVVEVTESKEPSALHSSQTKDDDDVVDENGPKILSKKEKEKLKKEREKVWFERDRFTRYTFYSCFKSFRRRKRRKRLRRKYKKEPKSLRQKSHFNLVNLHPSRLRRKRTALRMTLAAGRVTRKKRRKRKRRRRKRSPHPYRSRKKGEQASAL